MATLLKNVTNCIWHAFESLQQNAVVHKSKLKVLTANIGTLLDLYGVEKGLDHFRSSQELTFDEFRYYLQHEVFSSLPKATTLHVIRDYEKKISEVCWLVCRKSLVSRDKPVFTDDSVFKLFRIFCLLADLVQDADDTKRYLVVLQPSEAGLVAEQLVHCLGLRWDAADWEALGSSIGHFRWAAFLAVLEAKYCADQAHSKALVEAVDEIYDVFIEDIIKKGYLFKRGYLLPTMREYWCVLQPCALTYYKSSSQKEQCGRVSIDEYCSVEAAAGEGKLQRFQLVTTDRTFEFGTQDHKYVLTRMSGTSTSTKPARSRTTKARRRRSSAGVWPSTSTVLWKPRPARASFSASSSSPLIGRSSSGLRITSEFLQGCPVLVPPPSLLAHVLQKLIPEGAVRARGHRRVLLCGSSGRRGQAAALPARHY